MDDLENKTENLCPIKEDCLFYQKPIPIYHSETEKMFLVKYCLKGGEGCGLKRNYDVSERLKRLQNASKNI